MEVWCRSGCVWCWLGGESHNVVECGSFCQCWWHEGMWIGICRLTVGKKWHLVCRGSPVRSALLLLLPLPRQGTQVIVWLAENRQEAGIVIWQQPSAPHCGCLEGWLLYRTAAER